MAFFLSNLEMAFCEACVALRTAIQRFVNSLWRFMKFKCGDVWTLRGVPQSFCMGFCEVCVAFS